ncbi:MAG: hypothetical protein DME22_23015, partial [Verrucomicrobia bacterium]
IMNWRKSIRLMPPDDQLTDGGSSVTPELPSGVAGPPFGASPFPFVKTQYKAITPKRAITTTTVQN